MKLKEMVEIGMVVVLLAATIFMMMCGVGTVLWWFSMEADTILHQVYLEVVVCAELLRFLIAAVCFGAAAVLIQRGALGPLLAPKSNPFAEGTKNYPPIAPPAP